jgi:signal transduction histidine kinase
MNGKIETMFKNIFFLKYSNKETQNSYDNYIRKINNKNIYFSVVILIIQLSSLLLNILNKDLSFDSKMTIEEKNKATITSIKMTKNILLVLSTLILVIINLIANVLTITNRLQQYKINNFTYLCLNLNLLSLRSFIFILFEIDSDILLCVETAVNFTFLMLIRTECFPIAISNLILLLTFWTISISYTNFPLLQGLAFTGIHIIISAVGYAMDKNSKRIYYKRTSMASNSSIFYNTMENISNGYIILKDGKIQYANEYLKSNFSFLLEKNFNYPENEPDINIRLNHFNQPVRNVNCVNTFPKVENSLHQQTISVLKKNYDNILNSNQNLQSNHDYILYLNKETLKGFQTVNPHLPFEIQNILSGNNKLLNDTLAIFTSKRENISFFESFTFLGEKNFTKFNEGNKSKGLTQLGISMRIQEESHGEFKFEFIFKDLSHEIRVQNLKTEIETKTMALAKISHEFKNPVIIIGELAQLISEEVNNGRCDDKSLQENLNLMNNLTAYILILVKDFEVISKKEACSSIELVFSWFDLRKEISNLNGIVLTLISKKFGEALAPIDFIVKIDENVPYQIHGDKMRLLQILINLISNSIKFTEIGSITLLIQYYENKVLFSVEDMGCGLSEDQVKNLFKEYAFKSNGESNSHGSGLGLSIVKELCSKMGSTINFSHNRPQGSIFSFILEQNSLRSPVSNNPNRKILDDFKRVRTILSDKIQKACTKKNIGNMNLSQSYISEQNELKNSSGDLSQPKRVDLNNTNSFKNLTMFTNLSTYKTIAIDSVQVMSQPPLLDSNNNVILPFKKTSNLSIQKFISESERRFPIQNYYKQNGLTTISEISITNFEMSIPASETSLFFKSRMKIKKILNKNLVPTGNIVKQGKLTIIIVDDDKLIRRSIIRTLENFFESFSSEVDLIELPDAVECLFAMYNSIINHQKIDLILTDESMNYMSGSILVELASKLFGNKIPIAILTSYEGGIFKSDSSYLLPVVSNTNRAVLSRANSVNSALVGVFQKPLSALDFEKILTCSSLNY